MQEKDFLLQKQKFLMKQTEEFQTKVNQDVLTTPSLTLSTITTNATDSFQPIASNALVAYNKPNQQENHKLLPQSMNRENRRFQHNQNEYEEAFQQPSRRPLQNQQILYDDEPSQKLYRRSQEHFQNEYCEAFQQPLRRHLQNQQILHEAPRESYRRSQAIHHQQPLHYQVIHEPDRISQNVLQTEYDDELQQSYRRPMSRQTVYETVHDQQRRPQQQLITESFRAQNRLLPQAHFITQEVQQFQTQKSVYRQPRASYYETDDCYYNNNRNSRDGY